MGDRRGLNTACRLPMEAEKDEWRCGGRSLLLERSVVTPKAKEIAKCFNNAEARIFLSVMRAFDERVHA